ncbi:MAG: hypothetical protein V1843_04115 [bacterium]
MKKASLTILLFFILIVSSNHIYASWPINLKADTLYFDDNTGNLVAKGNVGVALSGISFEAQALVVDVNAGIATAEGEVVIYRQDYRGTVDSLTYYSSGEVAVGSNFSSVIQLPRVKGDVYTRADKVYERADLMEGYDSTATTCDKGSPHFYMQAAKVEYYPGDRIVGWDVNIYVGKTKVFWFPFFVFDLKKRRVSLKTPVVGQNAVEGAFVKTSVGYYVDKGADGEVYLDLMQYKGTGAGFMHNYDLGRFGFGSVLLYNILEQDIYKEDWVVGLRHELALSPEWRLSLYEGYSDIYLIPSGRSNLTSSKVALSFDKGDEMLVYDFNRTVDRISFQEKNIFRINRSTNSIYTQFYYDATQNTTWSRSLQQLMRFSHQQNISTNLSYSLDTSYSKIVTMEGAVADEKMEPKFNLRYIGPSYIMNLKANYFMDLDKDAYRADSNQEYVEVMPELDIDFSAINLGLFPISTSLGVGTYHEAKYITQLKILREYQSMRYKFGLMGSKEFGMPLASSLLISLAWDQYLYKPGDARFTLSQGEVLTTRGWDFFENKLSYQKVQSEGNSPFFFDSIGVDKNQIKDTIALFRGDKARFSIDGGYNYLNKQYFDIIGTLSLTPDPGMKFYMTSGYSIEDKKYCDLVSTIRLVPVPWFITEGGITHDFNEGQLKSANSMLDWTIGEGQENKWRFKVRHSYDFNTRQYMLRDLEAIKDLHCWEMSFVYSEFLKESRVTFSLKAFPEQSATFVAGGRGFNIEGLHTESPRRYEW